MGVALAEECYLRGADVLLLKSKSSVKPRYQIKEKIFTTAEDLFALIKDNVRKTDYFYQTAAVSDYKVGEAFKGKLPSQKPATLKLFPQVKIIDQLKKLSPKTFLVAFKAVYSSDEKLLIKEGQKKLKESKANAVVVNDVSRSDRGFESDNNEVYVVLGDQSVKKIPYASKRQIAKNIVDLFL